MTDFCRTFGGFYLGSIGSAPAQLGRDGVTAMDVLVYPELGREAVFKVSAKDFLAFLIIDDKGNDFCASFRG